MVNHDATRGLVLLHRKIGRWLQPGGHADGEGSLAGVALREATEETGIDGLQVWTEPVDIDMHLFVNRRHTEPDHLHFDVRFLIRAPRRAVTRGNHESEELRWVAGDQLDEPELGLDASTRRLARYGFDLARTLRQHSDE
ncbi:NUDIX hydrolase [Candidatus Poriferisodalis sp.]|uniref:NUDIX hydrolase n=1 Tax=Candidatus Poriferisodalis sp. TaxID=3101277 RepID=UPI003B01D4F6